jgi:uncharacterized protein
MKPLVLFFVLAQAGFAQATLEGNWDAARISGQSKTRLLLTLAAPVEGRYRGSVTNLDAGSANVLAEVSVTGNEVKFESFTGTINTDQTEIKGTWEKETPLTFIRRSPPPSHVVNDYDKKEVMIAARDGVKLHTIIYTPKKAGPPLPFLIERSPYGWSGSDGMINIVLSELARDGYIFVFQDIRGRYQSEGQFVMQRPVRDMRDPKAIDEGSDTYDTIEWMLKNIPNNNGRAGMMGVSYGGWLTQMALIDPHPALKAASEQASPADMFLGDDFHHNGAFRLSYGFEYAAMMETGKENKPFQFGGYDTYDWYLKLGPLRNANARYFDGQRPTWNNFIAHPNYDQFWQKNAVQKIIGKPKVPNLNVSGWFDQEDLAGPFRIFAASEPSDLNYLVVGPWNHGGWSASYGRRLKNIDFGSNTGTYYREKVQARWFGYWLKDKGPLDLPKVLTFQTGSNEWKSYTAWPPKDHVAQKKLYFHASGLASFEPAEETDAFDAYVSDPARPVPYRERPIPETYGGAPGWSTWHVDDQRFAESRPDVAVWRTKPLETDVEISGAIVADLFASTTGSDADWVVKLIDEYPEKEPSDPTLGGYELMIAADVLRGRFRDGFEAPKPVKPGEIVEYRVDLLSHNHKFRKGHRIQVQVQSSWFPVIDRNPQKFVPNIWEAGDADFQSATQKVFRSKGHASGVLLPVASN